MDDSHAYSLTEKPFVAAITPPEDGGEGAYLFAFRGFRLLVEEGEEGTAVPFATTPEALGLVPLSRHYLGTLDGRACYALELAEDAQAPEGMAFRGLRSLYGRLDEDFFWVAGRAVQIVDWDRSHRFCGRCGAETELQAKERARVCPHCDHSYYPRLAPAIIVAVTRGDRLLLARSHRHPAGLYSVLAGFVEPGETLEECVLREVKEEVGIDVTNIRYFGSQPWPFPHSLMIAFTCQYAGGEIVLGEEEMADAAWFEAGDLPRVPPPLSISRHLIDWFVARNPS
jgi:NAD+ diphosphatase